MADDDDGLSFETITFRVTNEVGDFIRKIAEDHGQTVDAYLRTSMEYARAALSMLDRQEAKANEARFKIPSAVPFPKGGSYL